MNIYFKLNDDIKEIIDNKIWTIHKQEINKNAFICRRLRLNLYEITNCFPLSNKEKNIIDWLCFNVLEKQFNSKTPNTELLFEIITWNDYLETRKNKPDFQTLYNLIFGEIVEWCEKNICCENKFQNISLLFGFNICDMYNHFIDMYDIIELLEMDNYYPNLFSSYILEFVEQIELKSFSYELDEDDDFIYYSDTSEDY